MSYDTRILQLQKEWTDKYVVVDATRPELRRFEGQTGTVKTVNMSGRALVQFDAHLNIGWYDIDLSYLKKIDAPLPKPEVKEAKAEKPKPAAKPAAEAKPAATGGKNVADILAAARGGGAKPAAPAGEAKKASVADILAAARGGKAAAPAAPKAEATPAAKETPAAKAPAADPKKMSVADIMAAARGKAPAAKTEAAAAPAAKAEPPKPAAPAEKPAPPAAEPPPAAPAGGVQSMKGKFKTAEEIAAYVRKSAGK
jgi:hypothetical protein